MKEYPFIQCEHPLHVTNSYTGREVVVPCRHCNACLLNAARSRTFLCDVEEDYHAYCFFVTLTYNRRSMPTFRIEPYEGHIGYWRYINCTPRIAPVGIEIVSFSNSKCDLSSPGRLADLNKKSKYTKDNHFGYAPMVDCRNFVKRLRDYIWRSSCKAHNKVERYDSIRTYCVSEYGPKTFRPHFHLLVYTDSQYASAIMRSAVRNCWKFGRCSTERSNGQCSNYLSGYLNSYSALPSFLNFKALRPTCSHSLYFGSLIHQTLAEKMFTSPVQDLLQLHLIVKGNEFDKSIWPTLYGHFFPKCSRFADKSFGELMFTYRLEAHARYAMKSPYCSLRSLAKKLVYHINKYSRLSQHDKVSHYPTPFLHSCRRIYEMYLDRNTSSYTQLRDSSYDKQVECILRDLYISRRFHKLVGTWDYTYCSQYVQRINDFYKAKEYNNLVQFYQSQEDYTSLYGTDDYHLFYDNFILPFKSSKSDIYDLIKDYPIIQRKFLHTYINYDKQTPPHLSSKFNQNKMYYTFVRHNTLEMAKAIKHKVQNDLNNKFIY